ncbi:MAG TPA: hypothetical protein VKB67_01985 [Rhizomicrobium sp.]|nr:hypothetical protein [Rhizomicrobium sp.]
MEPSSKKGELPAGVSEEELYDGDPVVHFPSGKVSFVRPEADAPSGNPAPPASHNPAPEALVRPIPQALPAITLPLASGPPPPPSTAALKASYPAAIELALDILSHRVRYMVALITACMIWGYVIMWTADLWHILGASVFSVLILAPMMLVEWRRAGAEEG